MSTFLYTHVRYAPEGEVCAFYKKHLIQRPLLSRGAEIRSRTAHAPHAHRGEWRIDAYNDGPPYWDITMRHASRFANYTRLHPTRSMIRSYISMEAMLSRERSLKIRRDVCNSAIPTEDVANDLWEDVLFAHLLQSFEWVFDSYRISWNVLPQVFCFY